MKRDRAALSLVLPLVFGIGACSSGGGAGSSCGSSEAQFVGADGRTVNLASCAGLVDVQPLPTVEVTHGSTFRIRAAQPAALSADPAVLSIHGMSVTALAPGTSQITVRGMSCVPRVINGKEVQPGTCPLITVTVS